MSSLYRLKTAKKKLKSIQVQHDLSLLERERLDVLIEEAKLLNVEAKNENFVYKVRGPPSALQIVKVFKEKNF